MVFLSPVLKPKTIHIYRASYRRKQRTMTPIGFDSNGLVTEILPSALYNEIPFTLKAHFIFLCLCQLVVSSKTVLFSSCISPENILTSSSSLLNTQFQ